MWLFFKVLPYSSFNCLVDSVWHCHRLFEEKGAYCFGFVFSLVCGMYTVYIGMFVLGVNGRLYSLVTLPGNIVYYFFNHVWKPNALYVPINVFPRVG